MTESQAREEICRVGQSLFARGYVHASAGNISVRLDDALGGGFLITPTDACLGFLDPARLARLDDKLNQISGDKASKTIALHAGISSASRVFDAKTCCVIHTHSTHCVGLTLRPNASATSAAVTGFDGTPELLPALTPYFVMKVGHVPRIPYHRPGAAEVVQAVTQAIARYGAYGTPIRAVMLERLGPNVWHDSPIAAMATLEELEETAKLFSHAVSGDAPAPLTASQIQALRDTFGARW